MICIKSTSFNNTIFCRHNSHLCQATLLNVYYIRPNFKISERLEYICHSMIFCQRQHFFFIANAFQNVKVQSKDISRKQQDRKKGKFSSGLYKFVNQKPVI